MGETSREDTIALTRSKIGIYYLRESMGIYISQGWGYGGQGWAFTYLGK